jgi:diguanylate cyclase
MNVFHPDGPPAKEQQRLKDLKSLNLLDSPREEQFEVITQLAAKSLDTPIALISLLDQHRQWFKSCVGLDVKETPRDISMCTEAIKEVELLVVDDASKDPRFADNPMVTGDPFIRFYAGAVIRSPQGQPLGTLCVIDRKPRTLHESERKQLLRLARLVESEIRQKNLVGQLLNELEKDKGHGGSAPIPGRQGIYDQLAELIAENKPVVIALGKIRPFELASSLQIDETALRKELEQHLRKLPLEVSFGLWRNEQFIAYREGVPPVATTALLSDLEKAFHAAFERPRHGRYATVCVGLSCFPQDGHSPRSLLQRANEVMPPHTSTSKLLNVGIYSSEGKTPTQFKDDVLSRLHEGIIHERFYLVYQPIVEVATGKLVRAEALLRWADPTLGDVSPADFIPIAEESGLIVRIGAFVLHNVVQDLMMIKDQGRPIVPISINISGKQLRDPEFTEFLREVVATATLEPGDLELEITESSLIEDLQRASATLNEIHKTGITCAIDDFGVGFSSFNYLRRLPVRTLKIDREFVQSIDTSERDRNIVAAIISLAHALGMVVTAEGVEQESQRLQLLALGCDLMQGYLTGRPDSFSRLLEYR